MPCNLCTTGIKISFYIIITIWANYNNYVRHIKSIMYNFVFFMESTALYPSVMSQDWAKIKLIKSKSNWSNQNQTDQIKINLIKSKSIWSNQNQTDQIKIKLINSKSNWSNQNQTDQIKIKLINSKSNWSNQNQTGIELPTFKTKVTAGSYTDGLVISANAVDLLQSCTKPSIPYFYTPYSY